MALLTIVASLSVLVVTCSGQGGNTNAMPGGSMPGGMNNMNGSMPGGMNGMNGSMPDMMDMLYGQMGGGMMGKVNGFMLVATSNELRMIELSKKMPKNMPIKVENLGYVTGMEYDPMEEFVYWTTNETINRIKLDGSEQSTIFMGLKGVQGIAIDMKERRLFWTVRDTKSIETSTLYGAGRKTVLTAMSGYPNDIVVYNSPNMSYMMWMHEGDKVTIESAGLDGSGRKVLVNTSMDDSYGFAIDPYYRNVFWADYEGGSIEKAGFDGSNQTTVYNTTKPRGVAKFGGALYLTSENRIYRLEKGPRVSLVAGLSREVKYIRVTMKSMKDYMPMPMPPVTRPPQPPRDDGRNTGQLLMIGMIPSSVIAITLIICVTVCCVRKIDQK